VGKVSKAIFFKKINKKRNWVGGWEKMKFPEKKNRDQEGGKKLGRGQAENKVAKKKLGSGLRKGKEKKSTWDGTRIEKRILSVHHPSTLVHWVGAGSLWPIYYIICTIVISTEIQVVSPTVMNIDATHLMQHVFPSELA